ncbi:unnamed protein product, partial [Phaeothamnion confervicola]
AGGAQGGSYQRPLLLLLDRSVDLVTALRHSSTYQALLDDMLDHRLNRVILDVDGGGGASGSGKSGGGAAAGKKRRTYDVDGETDSFYAAHKGAPFPEAIEANGTELAAVTQKEEAIRRKTTAAGINVDSAMAGGSALGAASAAAGAGGGTTQELAAAVESLPGLLEQKKALEMHTNILKAVMDVVAAREVPVYFEAEEDMVMTSRADKTRLQQLLGPGGKGSLRDKLRLLAVYCLAMRPASADMTELEGVLRDAAAAAGPAAAAEAARGLAALGYLRRQVSLQHLPTTQDAAAGGGGGGGGGASGEAPRSGPKYIQGLLAMAQTQATGLLAKAAATAGQLLSRANHTYVTSVVHSLLEHGEEDDSYLFLDPKLRGATVDVAAARARAPPPHDVVVFLIGGGNYAEFQNLQDYAARRGPAAPPLAITYGCTQLVNAEAFLAQLYKLGGHPPS